MATKIDNGVEHVATPFSASTIYEQEALGSAPAYELQLKRKSANSIPATVKSSKPSHTISLENGTNDIGPSPASNYLAAESKVETITNSILSSNQANVIQNREVVNVNGNSISLPRSQIPSSFNQLEDVTIRPGTALRVDSNIKLSSPSFPFGDTAPFVAVRDDRNTEFSSTTPSQTVITLSSSASVQDDFNLPTSTPASSNATIDCIEIPGSNYHQIPSISPSKEKWDKLALDCTIKLAESKFDEPGWREGVPLDDFVVVVKEHFTDLKATNWYSSQTILAWRASLTIPSNWIVILDDEDLKKFPISERITDIIQIRFENERRHWTVVCLSIKNWRVTYYDSFLGIGNKTSDDLNMKSACTYLVNAVQSKYPKHGVTLPSQDPPMSATVSYVQTIFQHTQY